MPEKTDSYRKAGTNAARPLFFINASHPGAWEDVGGLPPAVRTLFHLKSFGLKEGFLFQDGPHDLSGFERWVGDLCLRRVSIQEDIWTAMRPFSGLAEDFLYVDAAHLIDPRILGRLVSAPDSVIASMSPSERQETMLRAGFLKQAEFTRLCRKGPAAVAGAVDVLYPWMIDPFSPEIRGPLPPYFMEVRSKEEARRATRVLIASQQKQVMDFPSEFIDPPFENFLTLLLCRTPVTPNMVTLCGIFTAGIAAWLFYHGFYPAGAFLGFALQIIDGVDGKLARTKLYFTRIGEQEALIDYFCENGLYAALGAGLHPAGIGPPLLAGLLILSDTADNIFYTLGLKWFGQSIDLFSPFDGRFRRFAGRRNIYMLMFIIGFSMGYPVFTLGLASVWAAVTAAIHAIRLSQHRRKSRAAIIAYTGGPG